MSPGEVIRQALDMPAVAAFYGHKPNRSGFICCPIHHEKTPSLKLYPKRWKCFGCGEGGDAITFVMKVLNITSFRDAVARLSQDFGLGITTRKADPLLLARIAARKAREAAEAERHQQHLNGLLARRRTAWDVLQGKAPHRQPERLSDGDVFWPSEYVTAAMRIDYLDHLIESG